MGASVTRTPHRKRAFVLALAIATTTTAAGPGFASPDLKGDHRPAPQVKRQAGRNTMYLGRRPVWTGKDRERVVTAAVWSRASDGLAFATRDALGALSLVVVLVGGPADRHVMRWPLPPGAVAHRPTITWLDDQRVAVGPSTLQPAVVASWRLRPAP